MPVNRRRGMYPVGWAAPLWVVFLLTGCGSEPAAAPVRLAVICWPGYDFLHLAADKGFFAAEGVDVRLVEFLSLGDARRAFERGQVDGLGCTLVEVLLARELSTRKPQIFYMVDYSNGADVLLARKPLQSVAELRGRRVGVEPATLDVVFLARALATAGLTLQEVQLVMLSQNKKGTAFAGGEVDAVTAYPPISAAILGEGQADVIFDSSQIPGEIVDVLAADEELLRQRPLAFAGLLRAFERARRFAETHPAEALALMAEHERLEVAEFRQHLDKVKLFSMVDQVSLLSRWGALRKALAHSDRSLQEIGMLPRRPKGEEMLTMEPLQRAMAP